MNKLLLTLVILAPVSFTHAMNEKYPEQDLLHALLRNLKMLDDKDIVVAAVGVAEKLVKAKTVEIAATKNEQERAQKLEQLPDTMRMLEFLMREKNALLMREKKRQEKLRHYDERLEHEWKAQRLLLEREQQFARGRYYGLPASDSQDDRYSSRLHYGEYRRPDSDAISAREYIYREHQRSQQLHEQLEKMTQEQSRPTHARKNSLELQRAQAAKSMFSPIDDARRAVLEGNVAKLVTILDANKFAPETIGDLLGLACELNRSEIVSLLFEKMESATIVINTSSQDFQFGPNDHSNN